jgi:hypothetical protein
MLEHIQWEAIVVDECQRCINSSHCEVIKMLHTKWRLLLVSGHLKVCFLYFIFVYYYIYMYK